MLRQSRWAEKHPDEKMKTAADVLETTRKGRFRDTPFDKIPLEWETKIDELARPIKSVDDAFDLAFRMSLEVYTRHVSLP